MGVCVTMIVPVLIAIYTCIMYQLCMCVFTCLSLRRILYMIKLLDQTINMHPEREIVATVCLSLSMNRIITNNNNSVNQRMHNLLSILVSVTNHWSIAIIIIIFLSSLLHVVHETNLCQVLYVHVCMYYLWSLFVCPIVHVCTWCIVYCKSRHYLLMQFWPWT